MPLSIIGSCQKVVGWPWKNWILQMGHKHCETFCQLFLMYHLFHSRYGEEISEAINSSKRKEQLFFLG